MEWDWTIARICPICGKRFYATSKDWAYKQTIGRDNGHYSYEYLCTWSCLRKFQTIEEERQRYKKEHSFRGRRKNASGCDGNRNV